MRNLLSIPVVLLILALGLYACNDDEPCPSLLWYEDADADGRGNPDVSTTACEQPEGFVDDNTDDDDATPCLSPVLWYEDADGDGLGNPSVTASACIQPEGFVGNSNDDDDTVPCLDRVWYEDADGDGLGVPNVIVVACEQPEGYVDNSDDDDDTKFGTSEIERYDPSLVYDGYVLLNELGTEHLRLIDKRGLTMASWGFGVENALANDAELLNDGHLLYTLKIDPPPFEQGGFGGKIVLQNANKQVVWEYTLSSAEALQHHDVEMLPNGNVLVMVWTQQSQEAILEKGYVGAATTLNAESIYEINPNTNEVEWKWQVWDHLIQDQDDGRANYGVLSENPQKININYILDTPGFMHANGIDYDEERDLIFLSVRYYSEVWVIDHSTTMEEAAGEKGDLVYRFGNPETYNGTGERLFYRQHFPNLLEGNQPGKGNMLVFSNMHHETYSAVLEVELPDELVFGQEPIVVWEFSDPSLFSPILSGAERLPNGNTLIAVGTQNTVWEVTPNKEVAWKFQGSGVPSNLMWRAYSYDKDSPAVKAIGL